MKKSNNVRIYEFPQSFMDSYDTKVLLTIRKTMDTTKSQDFVCNI